jgi:hypothetical protein
MVEKDDSDWAESIYEAGSRGPPRPTRNFSLTEGHSDKALPLRYWSDLDKVAPPDRLVRNLLGTTTLALVYGEPGCGKTFFVTDLGMHIALGKEWYGRTVTAGAVLYVACEGVAGLTNRLAAFRKMWCPPSDVPFAVFAAAINIGPDGEDADVIIDAAHKVKERTGQPVQLIVVDTLARAMGGGDENSAKDMSAFIKACDQIRIGADATVLIVHHSGKSRQSGARGSSALLAAVDTAIEVTKSNDGTVRTAKVVKQKDGADGVTFGFALQLVEIGRDDEGEIITTCFVDPCEPGAKKKEVSTLSPREVKAFEVLRKMIATDGKQPPASDKIAADKVVETKTFRDELKRAGVTDATKPDSERGQWKQIKDGLFAKGAFAIQGEYCWSLTGKGGDGP